MQKNKYLKIKQIPLQTINRESVAHITNDDYDMMWAYIHRTLNQNDEELTFEILHQVILKYTNHIERNKDKYVSGGLFILIARSVIADYYTLKNKELDVNYTGNDLIDNYFETIENEFEKMEKMNIINEVVNELEDYQRELYQYSLTVPTLVLAKELGIPLQKLKRELNVIHKFIINQSKNKYKRL